MRAFVAALVVVVTFAALAGPPPTPVPIPTEERPLGPIITALEKTRGARPALAVARWYGDVLGVKTVTVPKTADESMVGSPPPAAGEAIARCELPRGEKKAAAAKLLAEFGDALPLKLQATALASAGKTAEAVAMLGKMVEQTAPTAPCTPEHPATTHSRLLALDSTEACLKALDPKADLSAVKKARERVQHCQKTTAPVPG